MGVNSLLNIGNHALFANQTALGVTGNNIANVNTIGYNRQTARFQEFSPIDAKPGQMGMGAHVSEITRSFDRLLENTFLSRYTLQSRYTEQSSVLKSVENVFNESNRKGISSGLNEFFSIWQKVANLPDDLATKQALVANTESITGTIRDTQSTLENYQKELDSYIADDVNSANELIKSIAALNNEIGKSHIEGVNNANTLMDQRDLMVRELSKIVDLTVQDKGGNDFSVRLKSGQPLVEGNTTYSLSFSGPRTEYKCEGFTGEAIVEGDDAYEYTLDFKDDKTFRVSLDGGKTWLRDAEGKETDFKVPPVGTSIRIKDIDIKFTADDFKEGDSINIVPKTGLYWHSPTRPPENITPQMYSDGTDDSRRLTGGRLTAYFNTRDYNLGRYQDKLDAMAETLIWEVNRTHSQGASKTPFSSFYGTEKVDYQDIPLGKSASGLHFSDKLQEGNLSIYIYDKDTGDLIESGPIDFDGSIDGITNFDPSKHSMNDVALGINSTYGDYLTAEVRDGKLSITSKDGTNVAFGQDNTGLLAGLGINTFFGGTGAKDIHIRDEIRSNMSLINSGKVNQSGVITAGDNSTALRIAGLATEAVQITTSWESSKQSITSYYAGLVSLSGADTRNAKFNHQYNTALAVDIDNRIASISGVSLDEEMTNIVRFQHSYTAAAKLITTADQMLQTILGLKQ